GRRSSGGRAGRARRRRSGRAGAWRAGARPRGAGPRAPRAAGRTSSASRCAPARPSRSGRRLRDRRGRDATPPFLVIRAFVEPLRVVVRRGAVVEAVHVVHAVAVQEGRVVESAGDPELVTYMRSSAKPLQALPLARARNDLDERDLAIASASHRASPDELEAVRALLAKAEAIEDDLECGAEDGSRLRHNCSGKHAGMLALCRARDWPARGYRLAGHPVQEGCRAEVAAAAEVDASG